MDLPSHLVERFADWTEHPAQMVRELFQVDPDPWQDEALEKFPTSRRLCMKACAGPGKTAVLAWLDINFMLTRLHPMIGATSISGDNLKSNLWSEIARWRAKAPILDHIFEQTKTAFYHREHPQTWRTEARTWPKDADPNQIGNALRGLHANYVMWLLDESGGYPDAIMPVVETIFAGSPLEAHIVQAGNPSALSGPLYKACTVARDLWALIEITADPDDPKRTSRVSVEFAREQIKQHGRDNPWILVTIFGRFPPSAFNSLIGPDEVRDAMARIRTEHEIQNAPRVLGVDVAREGDDASVIFPRQGLQMFKPGVFRNIDGLQGAGIVNRKWQDWEVDAAFVDNTGGFGSSWIDQLRVLNRAPIPINFANAAHNADLYFNKRTEMYFDFVQWIKRGGALPDVPELVGDLTETTYCHKGDRLLLEPKDIVKKKLGRSPDWGDAGALTFAEPVVKKARTTAPPLQRIAEYDPFAELNAKVAKQLSEYDPNGGR